MRAADDFMSDASQVEIFEAGKPHRTPTLLPPLVRFVIAAIWVAAVFWGSGFVYAFFPGHNLLPGLLFRVVACVLTGGGFVFFLRVLDYNTRPVPVALGLPLDGTAVRQWGAGLALGGMLISADVFCIVWFGSMRFHLHLSQPVLVRAAAVAVLLFFGALLEELSFRGYPFQKLTQALGGFWAVVALSALFGAVHLANPDAQGWLSWGFFNTITVGVLFALGRIRSGSLWFSCGLHFGWNLFQGAVFGLPVSGLREFSTVVTASAQGPAVLTGGGYGPEGSAICSIILVVGFPLLWVVTGSQNIQHRPSGSSAPSGI
jgi:membrane protease YdiL (CAAX protease family)